MLLQKKKIVNKCLSLIFYFRSSWRRTILLNLWAKLDLHFKKFCIGTSSLSLMENKYGYLHIIYKLVLCKYRFSETKAETKTKFWKLLLETFICIPFHHLISYVLIGIFLVKCWIVGTMNCVITVTKSATDKKGNDMYIWGFIINVSGWDKGIH